MCAELGLDDGGTVKELMARVRLVLRAFSTHKRHQRKIDKHQQKLRRDAARLGQWWPW